MQAPPPQGPQQHTLEIPDESSGSIIGKNKSKISSIQKESGAKLVLDKNTLPNEPVMIPAPSLLSPLCCV